MNNTLLWNNYLGKLEVCATYHYKLRQQCEACNKPIVDRNTSGFCRKCGGKHRFVGIKSCQTVRNIRHELLKDKAVRFLEQLGCKDIIKEKIMPQNGLRSGIVAFDVVGRLNGELIAVECGSVAVNKFMTEINIIYLWPYNISRPVKWMRA